MTVLPRFLAVLLVASLPMLAVSGCSTAPRVQFANAQETYIATLTTLAANRDSFTDQEWQEDILPLVNSGEAALNQFDVLTAAGLPAGSATTTLRQILVALEPWLQDLD